MKIFFLVLARNEKHVNEKNEELKMLGVPYLIVCGRNLDLPKVIYREPRGKYDAINFGFRFIPEDTDVVVINDVDTRIRNFEAALRCFQSENTALVFVRICVKEGPQKLFYRILDCIRRRLLITASGELMLVRYNVLKRIIPIKSCKAEDSYILFKALEYKCTCIFCEECYVETERTKTAEKEEAYKRKTVGGIYQALAYTNPPFTIRVFYVLLPFFSSLLLLAHRNGYFWLKGILRGFVDYLRGDRSGTWQTTYME
jgi:cellulose synthase/poly-beta-1,6-N-acetylglucosamine synthase-like glycosyltransferase